MPACNPTDHPETEEQVHVITFGTDNEIFRLITNFEGTFYYSTHMLLHKEYVVVVVAVASTAVVVVSVVFIVSDKVK